MPCPRPVRSRQSIVTEEESALHVAERESKTQRSTLLYTAMNPGKRPIVAEDLWKFLRVGALAPAPSGLIVAVTGYDMEQNRGRSRLWLVPHEGEPHPLTSDEVSSTDPAVSPDGRRIAFARCRGEER